MKEVVNKKELLSLKNEVKREIKELKNRIRIEEKRDELSSKLDHLYDNLEGNELLLGAINMLLEETEEQALDEDELQETIGEFKDAIDFSYRNGSSFSSKDILDRILIH